MIDDCCQQSILGYRFSLVYYKVFWTTTRNGRTLTHTTIAWLQASDHILFEFAFTRRN